MLKRDAEPLRVCARRVSLHDYLLDVVAAAIVEMCESVARSFGVCVRVAAISQCSPLRSVKRVSQLLILFDRQVRERGEAGDKN